MTTDLFGKPLGGYPEYKLSLQQKRQATLLYHWTSREYLQGLKDLIDTLIKGADVNLTLAKLQGRNELLTNERWGVSDTAANWSTLVFPALEDFRKSTIWHIAQVANEVYGNTGASQCARMISEHSSLWMTPEEQERFQAQFEEVYRYAAKHNEVVGSTGYRPLSDSDMVLEWVENTARFPRLPKFHVRTDIEAETGHLTPCTGVYVPQDDPHGTLQFAWKGRTSRNDESGALGPCTTFNDLGLQALATAGRQALWVDKAAMFAFTKMPEADAVLRNDPAYLSVGVTEYNARAFVSSAAFVSRPCKWYFVERIEGEYDDEEMTLPSTSVGSGAATTRLRCDAGQPCPREGFWFTPAKAGSRRRFQQGEVMPAFSTDYGSTIWQWDERQGG